jgi:hypothetical protein
MANPTIGLRIVRPAGLSELAEGKIDALIERGLGYQPGYRCDRLVAGTGVDDHLICREGVADCPEVASLRTWLQLDSAGDYVVPKRRPRAIQT